MKTFSEVIEPKTTINELRKCIESDEFFFSKKEHNNDILIDEFEKDSRYIYEYKEPVKLKPIISLLSNYPHYVKTFFHNSEIEKRNVHNDKKDIVEWLEGIKGITEAGIIAEFEQKYTEIVKNKNLKSIEQIQKYTTFELLEAQTYIDSIKGDTYNLTPIDLRFLSKRYDIGFILITNKYSEKHACYIYADNDEQKANVLVLYQHNEYNGNHRLCCIKVGDEEVILDEEVIIQKKYVNTYEELNLSSGNKLSKC